MAKSIYIHIPFCKTKCPYCDFASWSNKENLIDQYFDALIKEIESKCTAYSVQHEADKKKNSKIAEIKTIFIGGGTPTLVAPDYYERLCKALKKYFHILHDAEITMECNPGTAKEDFFKGYKKIGINRISIGAQSFDENILEILGRKHSIEETIEAIDIVTKTGFENFSLDLIYGIPKMTMDIWEKTIHKALSFEPKHISSYSLTIEANTPFEAIYKDKTKLPCDDEVFFMYTKLCDILESQGFNHYEISNFGKAGYESKHNLTYWNAEEYFAFGNSAHRYLNELRTSNLRGLDEYIKSPNHEIIHDFTANKNFDKIMLTSRLKSGFEVSLLEKVSTKNKTEIKSMIQDLKSEGFIDINEGFINLTDKGMFLNYEILLKLT